MHKIFYILFLNLFFLKMGYSSDLSHSREDALLMDKMSEISRNVVYHFCENPGIEGNLLRNYDLSKYIENGLNKIKATFSNRAFVNDSFLLSSFLLAFNIPSAEWWFAAGCFLKKNLEFNLLLSYLDNYSPCIDTCNKIRVLRELKCRFSLSPRQIELTDDSIECYALKSAGNELCRKIKSHFQEARYQNYVGELKKIYKQDFKEKLEDFNIDVDQFMNTIASQIINDYSIKNVQEKILILSLKSLSPQSKEWEFLADYSLNKVGQLSFLIILFESTANLSYKTKLKILSKLDRIHTHKDFLTSYVMNMITLGTLRSDELLVALPLLQFHYLNVGEWLAVIDAVFTLSRVAPHLQDKSDEDIAHYLGAIEKKALLRRHMARFERSESLTDEERRLKSLKQQINELRCHKEVSCGFKELLSKTMPSIPLLTQQAILTHLRSHYPQEAEWFVDHVTQTLDDPSHSRNKGTITFVTTNENVGAGADYPDQLDFYKGNQYPSLKLIVPPLKSLGYTVEVLSFEDPNVDWNSRECLFLGHMWGYAQKQDQCYAWLDKIKAHNIPVVNPMDFVLWNINKTYLADLQEAHIPVIPTMIIPPDSLETFEEILEQAKHRWGTTDIIAKGVVDAGGGGYKHHNPSDPAGMALHIADLKSSKCGAVIQPYWPEIYQKGELSFVYIGNGFSHSYLKVPEQGSELVQLFRKAKSRHLKTSNFSETAEELFRDLHEFRPDLKISLSELVIAHGQIHELFYVLKNYFEENHMSIPPIIRIDCAIRNNRLYIMELEGIPYLEMELAMKHNPEKQVVRGYTEEVERLYSIYRRRDLLGAQ